MGSRVVAQLSNVKRPCVPLPIGEHADNADAPYDNPSSSIVSLKYACLQFLFWEYAGTLARIGPSPCQAPLTLLPANAGKLGGICVSIRRLGLAIASPPHLSSLISASS